MKVSVVIPTVDGREEYLERCIEGYRSRTDADVETIVVPNEISGGRAWQLGSERATGNWLHLTNDDIVPGEGWLDPCLASCERGNVPVVLIVIPTAEVLDEDTMMPLPGNPLTEHTSHFEGLPKIQDPGRLSHPTNESEYPSLPFCSMPQWQAIKPMIPTQYATDKWFGWRATQAGYRGECVPSVFYHYAAGVGRDFMIDGWLGQDRLTFDQNIAYPLYKGGQLAPDELHPEWNTLKGRQMSRDWYERHVGPYPWDDPRGEKK